MTEQEVFLAALDKEPAERAAFLDEACGGDAGLRRGVEALLWLQGQTHGFLDVPAVAQLAAQTPPDTAECGAAADNRTLPRPEGPAPLTFLTPSQRPDALGRLDHYEVLEIVGRGGMGVVLRARDTKLERIVAIKVLSAPFAASGTARQRFAREAKAAAAVRDEHVIGIHAVRNEAPVPYLVMEFIAGCSLEALVLRSGALEVKEVLRIGLQIARGLAAAHQQGLVHRDVKPANILLENGVQRVKLTDFGLARAADDASLTQSGLIAGTPLYMAPEQAAGDPIDARADLFSLGSVLYELCTGRPAFRAPTTVAVIRRVCDEAPRPIAEVNPDIPEPLCRLIERLHAKQPADRPASATEVADLLAGLLAELSQGKSRLPSRPSAAQRRAWHAGPTHGKWPWAAAGALALALVLAGLGVAEAAGVTDMRGTVVRLFLPAGTPVAEVGEPDVSIVRIGKEAAPLTEAERSEQPVAELPAELRVEAVTRRLKECNPGFDGYVEPTIRDEVVIGLRFNTDCVSDLSPVRALARLEFLECKGSVNRDGMLSDLSPLRGLPLKRLVFSDNQVIDLSPLHGMPLKQLYFARNRMLKDLTPLRGLPLEFLDCSHTGVDDLSPLKGIKLKRLWCDQTAVSDLAPLRGMPLKQLRIPYTRVTDLAPLHGLPLEMLALRHTPVTDLAPLRGMALRALDIDQLNVTDLAPLRGMPLTHLSLTFRPEQDAEIVRSLTTLQVINDKTPAEFWKEFDSK
jgi:hypothetical protein